MSAATPHEPTATPQVVGLNFARVADRAIVGLDRLGVEIVDRITAQTIGALTIREAGAWLRRHGYQHWPCAPRATWVRA